LLIDTNMIHSLRVLLNGNPISELLKGLQCVTVDRGVE
jgi:hypothetical protein